MKITEKEMIGFESGRLKVLREAEKRNGRRFFLCECECGKKKEVNFSHLRAKGVLSCGCLLKEKMSKISTKHGKRNERIYDTWRNMKKRTLKQHKNYSDRGITMCEEWLVFENFYEWAKKNGYEENLQIDRIDNDKGYYPNNCRFCTPLENNKNRRITVRVDGLTLKELTENFNIPYQTFKSFYYKHYKTKVITIKLFASQYRGK